MILFAAVDKEAGKGGGALLPANSRGEAAPFFVAVHPGVEADVSSASSIHACAFLIFTCAEQLPIILGVCSTRKYTVLTEMSEPVSICRHTTTCIHTSAQYKL